MPGDSALSLTAAELVAAFASGDLSPLDVTSETLAAIDQHDAVCNAFCHVDAENALTAAKAAEQRWYEGDPISWLDGVPVSIKDMFLMRGVPTLRGSKAVSPDQPWRTDSPVAARLREHGLVLIGKTNTAELGWKATTDNPLTGITRNPWQPRLTSGGSSGGSAAAVAAGMGPLSVGTDGGGSVRIPASFCGIVGFKPTHGRIPLYPASPFGPLAHAGPMTRSVDDVALLLDVLSQPDHRDPTALPPTNIPYRERMVRDPGTIRCAYSPTLGYIDVEPEIERVVGAVVTDLCATGLRVDAADPGFADPAAAFDILWSAGAAKWLDKFPEGSAAKIDAGLRRVWELGWSCSAAEYLAALEECARLGIKAGDFHTRYDVLITPMMPISPFEVGHDVPPGSRYESWPQWTRFSYPFNLTQQPAISLPVGTTSDGLPVGLQIVGAKHADDLVLAVARMVEQSVQWRGQPPIVSEPDRDPRTDQRRVVAREP